MDTRDNIVQLLHRYAAETRKPARDDCWPLATGTFAAEEWIAALNVLLDDRVTMGPQISAFEAEWSRMLGVDGSVMVNSGSSANLLSMSALTAADGGLLQPGDEVIVPALTWPTAVFPVSQTGCLPVLVDIDPRTLNLDPQAVADAITPRTRAIVVVHTLGNPCAMAEILPLAHRHGLVVLEDCCEAHGARSDGRMVGTFGTLATFSFYFSHHMSTIEGGIVCGAERWLDPLRSRRSHGWIRERRDRQQIMDQLGLSDGRWVFVSDGYNVRPTEINAAIGRVQLQRLDHFIAQRVALRERILERLRPHEAVLTAQCCRPADLHSAFGLALMLRDGDRTQRDGLCAFLESRHIETRPVVGGNLARQPAFAHIAHRCAGHLPGADAVHERGLMLGINPGTTDGQVEHLVNCLAEWSCGARTASA